MAHRLNCREQQCQQQADDGKNDPRAPAALAGEQGFVLVRLDAQRHTEECSERRGRGSNSKSCASQHPSHRLTREQRPDDLFALAPLETRPLGDRQWSLGLVGNGVRGQHPNGSYV